MKHPASIASLMLASALFCLTTQAKKPDRPGGGGGQDPPPTGTVYFYHDSLVWSMKPDGSEMTPLPLTGVGFGDQPSHELHNGQRWFTDRVSDGQPYYPNGRWFTSIQAVSEMGVPVPLLADQAIEVLAPPVWLPGDQSMSFIGERWALDGDGQPTSVAEAGLFVFNVDYDRTDNLVGVTPGSLSLVMDLSNQLRIGSGGFHYNSEVAGHSWSPTTMAFTFGVRHKEPDTAWEEEIWVIDLLHPENSGLLNNDSGVGWPEWSPDGRYIGFVSHAGTVFYDFDRNRERLLGATPSTSWGISHWSPDGSQFVVSHWDNFSGYDGIYRFKAALRGKTLLVDDSLCPDDNIPFNCTLITLGWRSLPVASE